MEMELFLSEILRTRTFCHMPQHRLKIVEELKNDGKEKVVCVECNKPVILVLAFKCTACPFFCHVSCFGETERFKSTFLFHFGSRHDELMLTEEQKIDGEEGVVCVVCKEKVEAGPRYKCSASECNFQLHKLCAQLPREMHHRSHPNHILILQWPMRDSSNSNCNACGNRCGERLFYKCEECDFIIDITCATDTHLNNIDDYQHIFVPIFKKIHFTCQACGQEGMDFASSCTICELLIHSRCVGFPRTMIISRHDHALSLIYSLHHQVKDFNNVFCKLCGQKVNTQYAAFSCQECDFVAHLYCAKACRSESLPENSVDVVEKINPGEIQQYFIHPHNLILSHDQELLHDKLCDGCMHFIISVPFYNCTQCNFFLHTTCAQLPKQKKHILHQHTLALLSCAPYAGGLFSCNACGRLRHGFTYRCDTCHFDMDVQCCSVPKTLGHEGHQHSLFLPVSSYKNCSVCDHEYQFSNIRGIFVCTACDFALDFKCATLPLVARHIYDEHLLVLTYAAKDNSEEHYCLIWEEERDPKHWFYYCATCDFPAHPQCVLEKYSHIKFGSTFTYKGHQHPITFVRKTRCSPPCDACGKTFDGMALQCSQCKLNVHYLKSCFDKLID